MTLLAAPPANAVVPGVLGFLVVAALGLALFFLLRSMNKQLRKVASPPPWQQDRQPGAPQAREGADADSRTGSGPASG